MFCTSAFRCISDFTFKKGTERRFFSLRGCGLLQQTGESEEQVQSYIFNELHRSFRFMHVEEGTDILSASEHLDDRGLDGAETGNRHESDTHVPAAQVVGSDAREGSRFRSFA